MECKDEMDAVPVLRSSPSSEGIKQQPDNFNKTQRSNNRRLSTPENTEIKGVPKAVWRFREFFPEVILCLNVKED